MFVIDESVAPELYPLAWMVGTWQGAGELGYPNIETAPFVQTATFTHDGGPYLEYHSEIRIPDDGDAEGEFSRVWAVESGYWRVLQDDEATAADKRARAAIAQAELAAANPNMPRPGMPAIPASVELLLAEPTGHVSVFVGEVNGARIDLVSDMVVRTASAADVSAVTRLYGYVSGELMWAMDMAAFGEPMQSYASARLSRIDDSVEKAQALLAKTAAAEEAAVQKQPVAADAEAMASDAQPETVGE